MIVAICKSNLNSQPEKRGKALRLCSISAGGGYVLSLRGIPMANENIPKPRVMLIGHWYKVALLMVAMTVCGHASSAQAASSCKAIRKDVKVTCSRSVQAIKRGGTSHSARKLRATLKANCSAKAKKFAAYCSDEVCGYIVPECPEGAMCIQSVITQTYKGLAEMKARGAQLLHRGACPL